MFVLGASTARWYSVARNGFGAPFPRAQWWKGDTDRAQLGQTRSVLAKTGVRTE
jgi:hypothetical protein